MIKDFADGKIKCFTEEVIPVKKVDIEFICTDQGAHKTIEDALKDALGDQITCQHIGCSDIEKELAEGKAGIAAVEITDDYKVEAAEETYEPGVQDFNGNI